MRHALRSDVVRFGLTAVLATLYSLLRTTEFSVWVKPLPILLWAIILCVSPRRPAANWVILSLVCAAIGDVLLDLGEAWLVMATIPFLGSTLILAYAFHLRGRAMWGRWLRELCLLLPIAVAAYMFHQTLAPLNPDAAGVGAALMFISTLLLWRAAAAALFVKPADDPRWLRWVGALGAFGIVSNYVLYSIDISVRPMPRDLVIQLYFWGQAFAAWSFLKPIQSDFATTAE